MPRISHAAGDHGARDALARYAAAVVLAAALVLPAWAAGRTHQVGMEDVAFAPAELTVRAGDSVTWENRDIVAHTATSEAAGFDVDIPPGNQGSAVVAWAGTFDYVCRYHPNMTGRIVVEP